jgi:hypothetical protein
MTELFLLEADHPETPPSNLCFHIDSKLPFSPNGGKSAASIGLPQGLAAHNQASSPVSRRQRETLDITTTFPFESPLIMGLHEAN